MRSETPDCHRTVLALPWLLNGSLEADERRAVREHLIRCPACRGELATTRTVLASVRQRRQSAAIPAAAARSDVRRRYGSSTLYRIGWAAMLAAVVASAGAFWWTNVRRHATAPTGVRSATAVQRAGGRTSTTPAEKLSTIDFESGALASLAVSPQPESPASASRRTSAPRRAERARAPRPSKISRLSFESGTLDQWQ